MGQVIHWILFMSLIFINEAQSFRCQKENVFDNTEFFSCPGPQDSPSDIYCCGNKFKRFCCSLPDFDDDGWIGKRPIEDATTNLDVKVVSSQQKQISEDDDNNDDEDIPNLSDSVAEPVQSIVNGLAKLVGIIVGVALFVVVVCIICCCCCPFCLCAKKRTQGAVLRSNTQIASPQANVGVSYTVPPEQFQQQQFVIGPNNPAYPQQGAAGTPAYPPAAGMGYQPGPAYPPGGQMAYPPGGQMAYPPGGQMGYSQDGQMAPQGYPMNPPPYPGLSTAQGPPTEYPPMEKSGYQTQPAQNPNY